MKKWSWEVESGWRLATRCGTKKEFKELQEFKEFKNRSQDPGLRRRSVWHILGLDRLRSNVEPFHSNSRSVFSVFAFLTVIIRPFFGRINCRQPPSLQGIQMEARSRIRLIASWEPARCPVANSWRYEKSANCFVSIISGFYGVVQTG
jgi:hypothetical protein